MKTFYMIFLLIFATVLNCNSQLCRLGIVRDDNNDVIFGNLINEKKQNSNANQSKKYIAHLSDDSINKDLNNSISHFSSKKITDKFIVYTNQAEGYLVISYNIGAIQNLIIQVVDVIGKTEITFKTGNINSGCHVLYIDLINSIGSSLATGFYKVIISSSNLQIGSFPITLNK